MVASHQHLAGQGLDEADNRVDENRLSGAGRSGEHEHLSGREPKRDVFESGQVVEFDGYIPNLDGSRSGRIFGSGLGHIRPPVWLTSLAPRKRDDPLADLSDCDGLNSPIGPLDRYLTWSYGCGGGVPTPGNFKLTHSLRPVPQRSQQLGRTFRQEADMRLSFSATDKQGPASRMERVRVPG